MPYLVENDKILLEIPNCNNGKFRFKERKNNFDFDKKIATRQTQFTDNTYKVRGDNKVLICFNMKDGCIIRIFLIILVPVFAI